MGQKTADGTAGRGEVARRLSRQEQGLAIDVYLRDSVWPSVALKKLAGNVEITNEDLQKGL